MSKRVTPKNFVRAETARYFAAQAARAPVNAWHHEREPVTRENQVALRSNVDLLHSFALVDVTEPATVSVPPSDTYQVAQVIDEQHYTVAVLSPGESATIRDADLSSGTHVFVLARTALADGPTRAHELQDRLGIAASAAEPYRPANWDDESRRAVGARLERRAADLDLGLAFGTPASTVRDHHLLGTRLGWGGLPPQHAQYFQGTAVSSGCDIWTFEVPPVDVDRHGFYSVAKYDENGWLDVVHPAIASPEFTRNGDGTISVYFGDANCVGGGNRIETAEGQTFFYAMRLYRPLDVGSARDYVDGLRRRGITRVLT
ncbi:DUF1254 domain-containing protein [Agromyces sp. SYSU T0242]|uniref:DUF1254 domain-containing protein n=1 Tax=Agromyces litoreus TaxID=3158561 RepID=UPI0033962FCB